MSSQTYVHVPGFFYSLCVWVLLCVCELTYLSLLPSAKEEQCVPEVSGRAAAVGNSR